MKINGVYIPRTRYDHFAKRASREEVYEVIENAEWPPLWIHAKPLGKSPTYLVHGRTIPGRYLLIPGIIFQEEPMKNFFMPITVRQMSKNEINYYLMHRKGELH